MVGSVLALGPLVAGVAFLIDPLRRRVAEGRWFQITSLDSLPVGQPRRFVIRADRRDAWSTYTNEPVGAVFLVRQEDDTVTAFQTICPHLGCSVNFDAGRARFFCPCHNSAFELDGDIIPPPEGQTNPAPRPMDSLEVRVDRQSRIVEVQYQEFVTGLHDKVART